MRGGVVFFVFFWEAEMCKNLCQSSQRGYHRPRYSRQGRNSGCFHMVFRSRGVEMGEFLTCGLVESWARSQCEMGKKRHLLEQKSRIVFI